MLVWVLLEGAAVNSQGASIPLEEGLWGPAGRASEPRESLWAKDVSGMREKPSSPIPVRTIFPALSLLQAGRQAGISQKLPTEAWPHSH